MSELRLLPAHEVPLLLPGARQFFADGLIAGQLHETHFVTTLAGHIERGSGFVVVAGQPLRGALAGILFQDLATAETCCMEFFWYVHASERGSLGVRLLAAFEQESFSRGAVRVIMAHFVNEKTSGFEALYTRRGYRMKEQLFQKERT
jgi:hypothetical protein